MTDLETVELAARRALVKTDDALIKVALKLLADEIAIIIRERRDGADDVIGAGRVGWRNTNDFGD